MTEAFSPSREYLEGSLIKVRNIESRVTTGPSNALFASPRSALFSLRILQVGAVKGLTIMIYRELNCSIARSLLPRAVGWGGGGGGGGGGGSTALYIQVQHSQG